MDVTRMSIQRKVLALSGGTLLIQFLFISIGFYLLKANLPSASTIASKISSVSESFEEKQQRDSSQSNTVAIKEAPSAMAATNVEKPAQVVTEQKTDLKPKTTTYIVEKGDTLSKIWQKNGGTNKGAISAAEAFKSASIPLSSLRPGDKILFSFGEDGDIQKMSKRVGDGRTLNLSGSSSAGYKSKIVEEKIDEKERIVTGAVLNSFAETSVSYSIPLTVVDDFVDLFSDRVEFRKDLKPGDTFTIIYTQRKLRDGTWLTPGPIKAASIKANGAIKAVIRDTDSSGKSRVYDENGHTLGNYFLRYPLQFTRISSVFSEARFHPILNIKRPHNGVDFAAPIGTPVRTIAEGIVEAAGSFGDSGTMVKISHNKTYSTAYLHLSKIAPGIQKGAHVARGQLIGAVGMSGLATGPHLHFSLYQNGVYIDPLKAKLPNMLDGETLTPPSYVLATLKSLRHQHDILSMASVAGVNPRA